MTATRGALFLQLARGKRSLTLNPTVTAGREVVRRLLMTADVVVANLPAAALAAMGLDAPSAHAVQPDLVLVTTDTYGPGPWADRPGFDGIGQVMSGSAHLSGPPDAPAKSHALWVDHLTGALNAFGVATALLQRTATGDGAHVQTALLHTALTVMAGALAEEAVQGPDRVGSHNRGQTSGPADVVATADGWVMLQVVSDRLFARFSNALDHPEWADDPRFATDLSRGDHRDDLAALIQPWFDARTTDVVLNDLAAAGIPSGPALSPREVLVHPHTEIADLRAARVV